MKKNEKKMILVLVIIAVVIIGAIFLITRNKKGNEEYNEIPQTVSEDSTKNTVEEKYVDVLEDGTKLNKSTKLNETKVVDGLEISNIQFTMKNGQTLLLADVKNNSGADRGISLIDVILYDDTGAQITTIHGIIGDVKAGETIKLQTETTLDYANAYDFSIVLK